jgi:hypothetical protein
VVVHGRKCNYPLFLLRENYNLALQTVSRFASRLTNCQRLDSGLPSYQKVLKMPILQNMPPSRVIFQLKNKIKKTNILFFLFKKKRK